MLFKYSDIVEPDVKDKEQYNRFFTVKRIRYILLCGARPLSTISQLLERYLYYADVCAFHHYPAWYPTNVPGNMDEVKQIPLIWEAGGWNGCETIQVFLLSLF